MIIRAKASQIGLILDRDNFEYPDLADVRHEHKSTDSASKPSPNSDQTHWPLGPFTPT